MNVLLLYTKSNFPVIDTVLVNILLHFAINGLAALAADRQVQDPRLVFVSD